MDRQLARQRRDYRHLPDARVNRNCRDLTAAPKTYTGHPPVRRSCAQWRHDRDLWLCAELYCARAANTFAQRVLHDIDWRGRSFAAGRRISQRPHRHPQHHHRRVHVNARHDSVRISSQGPTPRGFRLRPVGFSRRTSRCRVRTRHKPQDRQGVKRDIVAPLRGHDLPREGHMAVHCGLREFITLLGGAAAAWPLATRAQQRASPVIGLLSSRSRAVDAPLIAIIRQGLNETGFVDGQNVAFDYRWAEGQYDRLAGLAADLVRRQVAVIVTIGGEVSAAAAKAATATIPIVFATGADPIRSGLVTSLHRPGSNITGVSTFQVEMEPKRLELVRELLPHATTAAVLVNPNNPTAE